MDVGCYPLSAARMLAGEPERVAAEQVLGGDGVDVVFAATLRFPGEVIAHLDCGLALAARHELEIVGEEGVMVLADPWHCRAPGIELTREGRSEVVAVDAADPYRLEVENLSAAIRGQGAPLLGRDDAVGQAAAIQALHDAAEHGRTVSLI